MSSRRLANLRRRGQKENRPDKEALQTEIREYFGLFGTTQHVALGFPKLDLEIRKHLAALFPGLEDDDIRL